MNVIGRSETRETITSAIALLPSVGAHIVPTMNESPISAVEPMQRELPLQKQDGLWFWDIPRQKLTFEDFMAEIMQPSLDYYANKWAEELLNDR